MPRKIINAMNNVYTSIFEITKVDANNGYVYIKDIYSDKEYNIIDIGLSLNPKVIDNAYVYSRIMTLIISLLIHVLSQYTKMKKILK